MSFSTTSSWWSSLFSTASSLSTALQFTTLYIPISISLILFSTIYIIHRIQPSLPSNEHQPIINEKPNNHSRRKTSIRRSKRATKVLDLTEVAVQRMTSGLSARNHLLQQVKSTEVDRTRESSPTVSEDSEVEFDSPKEGSRYNNNMDMENIQSREIEEDLHTALNKETCSKRGKIWIPISKEENRKNEGESNGHEIYYEVHGDGPKRGVLIMGLGNSSLSYSSTITHFTIPSPTLSPSDYSICVLDNRGVGHSSCPKGLYTTKGMAEDVRVLLEELGWLKGDKVDIVGISLGGMIAMELATMIPDRVSSLILGVTTPGYGIIRNMPPWAGLSTTVKLMAVKDRRRRMKYIIDMCFPQKWLNEPAEVIAPGMVDLSGKTNEDVIFKLFEFRIANVKPQSAMGNLAQSAAALTHFVSPERLKVLNDVIPKICILTGDEDTLVDPRNSTYMHSLMPKSELITWENTGHGINVQRPARFNALLERVWNEGRL